MEAHPKSGLRLTATLGLTDNLAITEQTQRPITPQSFYLRKTIDTFTKDA